MEIKYPEAVTQGELTTRNIQENVWEYVGKYPQGGGKKKYRLVTLNSLGMFHGAYRINRAEILTASNTICVDIAIDYIAEMNRQASWRTCAKILCLGNENLNYGKKHAFVLVYGVVDFNSVFPSLTYIDPSEAIITTLDKADYNKMVVSNPQEMSKRAGIDSMIIV